MQQDDALYLEVVSFSLLTSTHNRTESMKSELTENNARLIPHKSLGTFKWLSPYRLEHVPADL